MLSHINFKAGDKVLDLGCGYGVVGIVAARYTAPENVYLLDIDEKVLACAARNLIINGSEGVHVILSDAYDAIDEIGFDMIISNPPYQTDFSTPKKFIEKGFNRLKIGGRIYMVTKRELWYKNKIAAIFGGVRVFESDGYFIFEAEKRRAKYANKDMKHAR